MRHRLLALAATLTLVVGVLAVAAILPGGRFLDMENHPPAALQAVASPAVISSQAAGSVSVDNSQSNGAATEASPTDGRQRQRVALLLIMDQSGSMSYDPRGTVPKIEMAKEALRLAARSLADGDQIGIIAFNDKHEWVVPMTTITDEPLRQEIDAKIAAIGAYGGTEILPALAVGLEAIRNVDADVRHIVLLSDGKARTGTREAYQKLLDDAMADRVTVSTIAIGEDADTDLLYFLADQGGGRYHFTERAEDLPLLTLEEAQHAGNQYEVVAEPTPGAAVSVYEVVGRAQAAVLQAGTYRYELTFVEESGERRLAQRWEVVVGGGRRMQDVESGALTYVDESKVYQKNEEGAWVSYFPPGGPSTDPLTEFVGSPVTDWSLLGLDSTESREAYVIERTGVFGSGAVATRQTYWIDTETFLPLKQFGKVVEMETQAAVEDVYSDFGAPIDVQVPPEALTAVSTSTPTPSPTPVRVDPSSLDPQVLHTLLSMPWYADEIPPGFPSINPGFLPDEERELLGAFGVRGFDFTRDVGLPTEESATHRIAYLIYPTASDAASDYDDFWYGATRQGYAGYGPEGFNNPAAVLSSQVLLPTQEYGYDAWCVVRVGNVLVVGRSAIPGSNQAQAETNAIDLARAGAAHLKRLLAGPELQEAEAAVRATKEAEHATAVAEQTAEAAVTATAVAEQATIEAERAYERAALAAAASISFEAGEPEFQRRSGVSLPVVVRNDDDREHTVTFQVVLWITVPGYGEEWIPLGHSNHELTVPANGAVTDLVLFEHVTGGLENAILRCLDCIMEDVLADGPNGFGEAKFFLYTVDGVFVAD